MSTLPIRLGAALRRRRLFHPVGVLAEGTLERVCPVGQGLPMASGEVIGRVSKGIGTPGAFPDIAGLAWKMPQPAPANPWDVLLASTAATSMGRVILIPATSWSRANFSSLMPLRYDDGVWWVRARVVTDIERSGLSLDVVTEVIGAGGLVFDIEQARGAGGFEPLARLTLRNPVSGRDVVFDPTQNTGPEVGLVPDWLTNIRRAAYKRSREGRGAE